MGYFVKTLRGLTYQSLMRVSIRVLSFAKWVIVARMLGPVELGLFGIASISLSFVETITETGIFVFLIQEKDKYTKCLGSALIISIIRGILISLIIAIGSSFVLLFFNMQNSRNILLLVAIVPLMRGFINPSIIKYEIELKFEKEIILRLFLYTIDVAVSIYFAYKYRVAESLIVGMFVAVFVELVFSWIFISPKPYLKTNIRQIKYIIKQGKWITFTGIFNYLFHNLDDIVVGKILGAYSLGVYQISYKIAALPIYEISEIFGKVTLPIYTKISFDKNRVKSAFFKTTVMISLISMFACAALFVFAEEIIIFVLGEEWFEAINIIKILAVFSLIRSISGSITPFLYALKRQDEVARYIFAGFLALSLLIVPMTIMLGIVGAAYSTIFAALFTLPFIWKSLKKVLF